MSVVFGEPGMNMTRLSASAPSPTAEFTGGGTSRTVPLPQHSLKSNLTYEHKEKYSPPVPRALVSSFRTCYEDFIHGRKIRDEDYNLLQRFKVSEDEFVKLVVNPELPGSQAIYLENNRIIFNEIPNDPYGQVIIEINNQIYTQDSAAGEYLICGTGNRTTIFQAFTDRRYSPWPQRH
jgi:hypothetical protein